MISQNPGAGTSVAANSPVNPVVSLGGLDLTTTFDANGGSAADPASRQVITGPGYGTLATTRRPGYAFGGWFTSTGGGTQVTETTVVTTLGNHTLHARPTVSVSASASGRRVWDADRIPPAMRHPAEAAGISPTIAEAGGDRCRRNEPAGSGG